MNPCGILGFVLGVFAALLALGLLQMAHRGEVEQDALEAYYRGVRDERERGQDRPESANQDKK